MTQRTFGQHPRPPVKVTNCNQWEIYETIWDEGQRGAANDALGTVNQFLKEIFIIKEVKKYKRNLAAAYHDNKKGT